MGRFLVDNWKIGSADLYDEGSGLVMILCLEFYLLLIRGG